MPITNKSVCLQNVCPECLDTLPSPTKLIYHLNSLHGIEIPARRGGPARPKNFTHAFVVRPQDAQSTFAACPSCWDLVPINEVNKLSAHFEFHAFKCRQQDQATVIDLRKSQGQVAAVSKDNKCKNFFKIFDKLITAFKS